MSIDKNLQDFKKEVEKLKEIDGAEEYARQLAHLFLGNGLSLQTILLMAIDFGQQHPQWIPVKDELPAVGETVQIYVEDLDDVVYGALQLTGDWWCEEYGCNFSNITYWMRKPAAPRQEE